MPTADRADAGAPQNATPARSEPRKDDLSTALAAAAEAGAQADTGDDIAADDAGGSKLSLEIGRERKLPTGKPPAADTPERADGSQT